MREDEPVQQDAVVFVEHDRTDGATQFRRHGMSDVAARTMIDTSGDYQFRSVFVLGLGAVLADLISLSQLWLAMLASRSAMRRSAKRLLSRAAASLSARQRISVS
ncbi:hypothetical protein [Micromonospora sp. NPDC005161]